MFFATKVGRPEIEVTNKEHKYLNHTFNYPGRVKWNPITLTIVDVQGAGADPASNDGGLNRLMVLLANAGYVVPGNTTYFSNTTIGFSLGTDANGFTSTSDKIMDQLSLDEKADQVQEFKTKLFDLFEQNGIDFTETPNEPNKTVVEFAINDKCNKLYDIAINKNNVCTKPRIGMSSFLRTSPFPVPRYAGNPVPVNSCSTFSIYRCV